MSASAPPTTVVHEPFRRSVPPVGPYARELWDRREFVVQMARSTLKAEHYQTAFGQLWNVLNPLLLAGVYFLLISVIREGRGDTAELLSRLIAGLFFFHYTRGAIQEGANSVIGGDRLALNTAFPRAVLPIAALVAALLRFLPSLPLYVVLHAVLGQPLTATLVVLPVLAIILSCFNLGIGMLLGAVTVYARDTRGFLPYVLRIWLYLTPVLWAPADLEGVVGTLLKLNPLYFPFASLQRAVTGEWPTMAGLGVSVVVAVGMAVVGAVFFLSRERDLAVHL